MSKQMKKTIFGILGGIVLMLLIAYLPPETEMMSRQCWQYLGCFGFLLTCLISGALPDWVATLATMVMLLVFKLGKVADVTVEFSGTTVWLCIGVFIMSVLKTGLANCGLQAPWQTFLTGAVVIGAVLLDIARTKAANRVKKG